MLPVLTGEASPPGSEPAGDCCEACAAARVAAHAAVPATTEPAPTEPAPLAATAATAAPLATRGLAPIQGMAPLGGTPGAARGPLPMLGPTIRPGVGIARSGDRRIAFGGLAVAALYVALAAASLLLPPSIRLGSWLPAHLVLAGGATTAIAAVLPFFTAALVVAPPAPPSIRIGGIALVAAGAIGAMTAYGHAGGQALPALLGGGAFLAGLGLVAAATFLPLRGALGPRRTLFSRAYALALANVVVGATLATLVVGGNGPVGAAWGALKPAHAWLNLVGFAGLVIVTTLLHLAPTIAGTRLKPRVSGRLAVIGLALGAPLVAAGYALELDALARAGALAVVAGAVGVAAHGAVIHFDRDRGRWTTDFGWHRFTSFALLAGQAWLGLGFVVAATRVLASGANPAGWSLSVLAGSLVIGGVAQVLVGAMTHLLPAIGPGDPIRHATQRALLGRWAVARLAAINAGAALVAVGFGPSAAPAAGGGAAGGTLVGIGLAWAAIGIASSIALFALAARPGGPTRFAVYAESTSGRG